MRTHGFGGGTRRAKGVAVALLASVGVFMDALAGSGEEAGSAAGRNRLAGSTSPYLLQHANNPVHWFPWGPEALETARRLQKPIFLSIGYSACHWCHVMEEESFEDAATASLMNRYFVSIKVDREERPDLDDIYMTAVQMLTGSGGWPMSVWLTPDLKPFYGGTYFPKDGRYGRPSFTQVLTSLGEAWSRDRDALVSQAERVHEAVTQYMTGRRTPPGGGALTRDLVSRAVDEMSSSFDQTNGGFGTAPKFPPHRSLVLLLSRYRQTRDESLLRMATLTFDRMACGGMYDQIGGGFHRYSTDARWLVPHFEKMLYDNALLAEAYLDAWQTTGRDFYRRIVRETLDWTLREMADSEGGFHSTLDADSEGEEGRFYVWRPSEVTAALGPTEGAWICDYFGITEAGNFEGGRSIASVRAPLEAPADRRRLEAARAALLKARNLRPRPHLDDKVLTAWNGLMIAALARAGLAFDEPRYLQAARRAAEFLLSHLRGPDGLMRVSWRKGRLHDEGFLDDQAFMVHGLLALRDATGEARWLAEAVALERATADAFWDPIGGGYFFPRAGRDDLIVRAKNPTDGAIPSGNSVMASCLLALHRLTGEASYRARAEKVLTAFRGGMDSMPGAFHNMLAALDVYASGGGHSATRPAVEVSARATTQQVAPGGRLLVEVRLDIGPEWHVNSATPTFSYLIPTAVTVAPDGPFSLEGIEYPEGKLQALGFASKPISVYEGVQTIRVSLLVDPSASPGPATVRGSLTFQACNKEVCLAPSQKSLAIEVRLTSTAGQS